MPEAWASRKTEAAPGLSQAEGGLSMTPKLPLLYRLRCWCYETTGRDVVAFVFILLLLAAVLFVASHLVIYDATP
jgi:hypothetical protein